MATLNLSINGPSISKSYQSIVNAPPPSGPAAASSTYGQWAVFSVSAPLANAFQQDSGNKESVLKVQSTGEGDLIDLIDEFSDGRIQFAYVKVKDPNTGLPKSVLIAWCGEGVPERTKGYFTSHLTAVAKLLHGYHVQITARSDRDLTPDSIVQKVADASGSKYSSDSGPPPVAATKPLVASKPVFTPTQTSGISSSYNSLARTGASRRDENVDGDGWGADAPPVTRTQLEKVAPAYQATKVNMRELTSQSPASTGLGHSRADEDRPGVVKGTYQPVGKVDITEIRRQARESGTLQDNRPETVRGAYEPVGKVDIAAIRARSQKPDDAASPPSSTQTISPARTGRSEDATSRPPSFAERSAAFSPGPERLTSLPKPKVAHKFGGSATFTGTRAPLPGSFESKPASSTPPVGSASRTFADQGGKTPAQLWAEKKARERGVSGSGDAVSPSGPVGHSPILSQTSGGGEWESGYTGKKWAPVQITHTGRSSIPEQPTGEAQNQADEEGGAAPLSPAGGIRSIRDRFSGAPPMGAPAVSTFDRGPPPAPEPDTSNKPNRGIPIPGLPISSAGQDPPPQPRSATPPSVRSASPIRVAIPVSQTAVTDVHEDPVSPPPTIPAPSMARAVPETTAAASLGQEAVHSIPAAATTGGERARAEYDYEAAEDNEVSLREGTEHVVPYLVDES